MANIHRTIRGHQSDTAWLTVSLSLDGELPHLLSAHPSERFTSQHSAYRNLVYVVSDIISVHLRDVNTFQA